MVEDTAEDVVGRGGVGEQLRKRVGTRTGTWHVRPFKRSLRML